MHRDRRLLMIAAACLAVACGWAGRAPAAPLSTQGFEQPVAPPWSSQPPMVAPTPRPVFEAPVGTLVHWQDQHGHTLTRTIDQGVTFVSGNLASLVGRYSGPQRDAYTVLDYPWITQGMLETEIGSASTATAYTALHRDYGVQANDPRAVQMAYDWCLLHCVGKMCNDPGDHTTAATVMLGLLAAGAAGAVALKRRKTTTANGGE